MHLGVLMKENMIGYCPRCETKLLATKLSCEDCGLELSGNFRLSKFDYLNREDEKFILDFLGLNGSFNELKNLYGLSYTAVRKKYDGILNKMGYEVNNTEEAHEMLSETKVDINPALVEKLKELAYSNKSFTTAGGRANLSVASMDEKNRTIKFKRSTGNTSWPCSISDIQNICYLVKNGVIEKDYKQAEELVPTFGNYIIGLLNHIGYDW